MRRRIMKEADGQSTPAAFSKVVISGPVLSVLTVTKSLFDGRIH